MPSVGKAVFVIMFRHYPKPVPPPPTPRLAASSAIKAAITSMEVTGVMEGITDLT